MIVPFPQIQDIIKSNPNKQLIANAKKVADNLMMHVFGSNLKDNINQYKFFEDTGIYNERKEGAISNTDLFARILQREEMVFNAQGGASHYDGLQPDQVIKFDATLDKIRYNMTIRKWIEEFALNAYRTDPMSVLFVEVSQDGTQAYPTYKSISCIFDYQTTGRKLEYICFSLSANDCINLGITDPLVKEMKPDAKTNYYRFVDDAQDLIVQNIDGDVKEYVQEGLKNPIVNIFKQVPAIISSDLINFANPQQFESPLCKMIELANNYLCDRSVRNLSKKYSGFAKVIEPLVECGVCNGTKFVSGAACPSCTIPGQDRGTGYKLTTKVSDVLRVDPNDLKEGFDYKKVFGYVSPDIKIWDKQDTSINDIENAMRDVYWGTYNRQSTTGPTKGNPTLEETATKTLSDLQPVYARLNKTADWAETTENALCNFIGQFLFTDTFKGSNRTYGRYYILETPDDLMEEYLEQKGKGAPQTVLNDTLSKYYHSLYAENKVQLAIQLKLMKVEPFVHYTLVQIQAANPAKMDFICKMYFSEWIATKDQPYLFITDLKTMVADLIAFAKDKATEAPELLVDPAVAINETIKNTQ